MVQYMNIYNELIECMENNLQVQKSELMTNIVNAIAFRILELKRNLWELESSPFHYVGTGLIVNKLTYDPEMTAVPKIKRSPLVKEAMESAFQRVKEKKKAPEEPEVLEEEEISDFTKLEQMRKEFMLKFGEEQEEQNENDVEENILSEEERVRMDHLNLIKAHEKLRQLTRSVKLATLKREAWAKELLGTAAPPARYELRQKAARFIQRIIRAYFEIKRNHIKECKRDQILGLAICKHPSVEKNIKVEQKPNNYAEFYEQYEKECASHKSKITQQYMIRKGDELSGDFRDRITAWFYEWFQSISFIHEIPKDGSITIFREELPDPEDWLEEYKEYLSKKKDNAGKNPQELKYEKQQAKVLQRQEKKQEKMRQKAEAALLKKMMRFPGMHPGYHYKQSKRTSELLELIHNYHKAWDDYDSQDRLEAKRKYINEINVQEAHMNVQLEILQKVDEDMKLIYLKLKNALQKNYNNIGEDMPEQFEKTKRKKKQKKLKAVHSERIADKLETLAIQGFVVDYPETKLEDYIGDPNFCGDDCRRLIMPTFPQSYEVRSYWWERCQEVAKGSQKILIIGPKLSGKTTLVYALASMNGACSDPWLARNHVLVKPFPNILLLPSLTYSLTELLIKNWINSYPSIPSTINVTNLAHMLAKYQKHSYGYLKKALVDFMTDERLDYERYLKWYFEKTPTGRKEKEHFEGQLHFKKIVAELAAKEEAKVKKSNKSAPISAASSRSAL
ncbi:unnamed protein product [Arctia plantaginis]|uniref:Uncharacterized protein n=1 Tax=Arctia plantaginis TaxID=874455 RepID=A0A8S1BPM6_ARCPL|nr:unnamed protein product [Arctia plantaginis]